MSRLSVNKAAAIKIDLAATAGREQAKIAKKHKVSRSAVSDLFSGRTHKSVAWPEGFEPVPGKKGGQHKPKQDCDPTNERILELESELIHLSDEKNRLASKYKASAKTDGLFKAMVKEMDVRIKPYSALPGVYRPKCKKNAIQEHMVMHLSDGHHDEVVVPEEVGMLERYDFPISCARAERYVDTVIEWTTDTLAPKFCFTDLWVLAYGDHTGGAIHGHTQRSYYRNTFRNCFAIGQLHALMYRDLAPHFDRVHVVYLPGNHGRMTPKKDYNGAHENWDFLIAEVARMHCRDLANMDFLIPNAFSVNLDINGIGFNCSHGDDIKSNGGVPWYGMVRRQKGLIALNSVNGSGAPLRYFVAGHHHVAATLADINGEMLINGAWIGTNSYSYNSFSGYREPSQWIHGVNSRHGITWRLNVRLKHEAELAGPKRYKIDGGRDVGPLRLP